MHACTTWSQIILAPYVSPPLQELYQEDRRVWHAIFEIAVQDLAAAGRDGINVGGGDGVIYPIILGNKGDWSYLATWQHLYFALCLYTF